MSETQKLSLPVVDLGRENEESRHVIWTGENVQLVLMAIPGRRGDRWGGA